MSYTPSAQLIVAEMREFAGFSACEQRYIRRSLDVGLGRSDAFRRWARNGEETASIRAQYVVYQDLKLLRRATDTNEGLDAIEAIMGPLMRVTTFDLAQDIGGGCEVEYVAQAFAISLDENRERWIARGDGKQVRRAFSLLPERGPHAGAALREQEGSAGGFAEFRGEERSAA